MESYIIKENVLTDDLLHVAGEGKSFKGGYFAIIEHFTYLNAWGDKKHVKRFRNNNTLIKYLEKEYKNFDYWNFF